MPAKTRTTVSLDAAILQEARKLGLNLSALLEDRLRQEIAKKKREAVWREENRDAIEAANAFVRKHGLWSDGLRLF